MFGCWNKNQLLIKFLPEEYSQDGRLNGGKLLFNFEVE